MGYLRWALAVGVILTHALYSKWYMGFGGANSVEIFFFISGFLMQLVIRKKYNSTGRFLLNRILRIYPTYYIVLMSTCVYLAYVRHESLLRNQNFGIGNQLLTSSIYLFSNLTLVGSDLINFLNISNLHGLSFILRDSGLGNLSTLAIIAPAWSLGLELTCYLFVPLVSKWRTKSILICIALIMSFRVYCFLEGYTEDPWTYRLFLFEFPIFLMGMLSARFALRNNFNKMISAPVVLGLVFMIFILIGTINFYLNPPRFLVLVFLLCFSLLILIYGKESKLSSYLGRISFPIYLSHVLIFQIFENSNSQIESRRFLPIFTYVLVVHIVGALLLVVVKPVESLRSRISGIRLERS